MAEKNNVSIDHGEGSGVEEQQPDYLHTIKENIAARLIMPNDNYPVGYTCNCNPPKQIVLSTCWKGLDKGRRVLKCGTDNGKGCSYMRFVDEPLTGRASEVIEFMHPTIEQLVYENTVARSYMRHLEDDYEILLKELNVSCPGWSSNLND